ncbi:MAG: hypothetical protein QOJ63_179 [Solirubrobacteraceae bacterium]|nr:hypothetical protein [Solirubrobacteraceae bacterium]
MTSAISPALALEYLATLWVDLRAGAVLDAAGETLAGDPGLARRAAGLLLGAEPGQTVSAEDSAGVLYAQRSEAHSIAVLVNPEALQAVVVCDLAEVLADLDGC